MGGRRWSPARAHLGICPACLEAVLAQEGAGGGMGLVGVDVHLLGSQLAGALQRLCKQGAAEALPPPGGVHHHVHMGHLLSGGQPGQVVPDQVLRVGRLGCHRAIAGRVVPGGGQLGAQGFCAGICAFLVFCFHGEAQIQQAGDIFFGVKGAENDLVCWHNQSGLVTMVAAT